MMAYVGHYGAQPRSDIRAMPFSTLREWARSLSRIIADENKVR